MTELVNVNAFNGITPENVLSKIESNDASSDAAWFCIDVWARYLFSSSGFLELTESQLIVLLKRDSLLIDEYLIFERVVAWGRAQLKKSSIEVNVNALKKQLSSVLMFIRFPCLSVSEVSQVATTQLLSEKQLVQLFQFCALSQTDCKAKIGDSLNDFSLIPRVQQKPPSNWTWTCIHCSYIATYNHTICPMCKVNRSPICIFMPPLSTEKKEEDLHHSTKHSSSSSSIVVMVEEKVIHKDKNWICPTCTLENSKLTPICLACDTAKLIDNNGNNIGNNTGNMWQCVMCSIDNEPGSFRCIACHTIQKQQIM